MSNLLFMMRVSVFIILILCLASCNINQDRFKVSSSSMNPNFEGGDIVTVNKTYDGVLDYGDLIACYQKGLWPDVESESVLFARIVGLPGDSIRVIHDICEINGRKNSFVLIQESSLVDYGCIYNEYEETFPNGKTIRILHRPDLELDEFITPTIRIPDGHYFIMADKRNDLYDSREFGTISTNQILGKVIKVVPANE